MKENLLPAVLIWLLANIRSSVGFQYMSGDFLSNPSEKSIQGQGYPSDEVDAFVEKEFGAYRRGRSTQFVDVPQNVRKTLNEWGDITAQAGQLPIRINTEPNGAAEAPTNGSEFNAFAYPSCRQPEIPKRLCKTTYNTTAPMFGMSLTSGKNVTIVQKFPDLLQQVTSEVCVTKQCDVVYGECVQTYMPHLFLVIPLGPVTLTGQDYILVESGCVCRPKLTQSSDTLNDIERF